MRITTHGIVKIAERLTEDASPKDLRTLAINLQLMSPVYAEIMLRQLEHVVRPDPGANGDA